MMHVWVGTPMHGLLQRRSCQIWTRPDQDIGGLHTQQAMHLHAQASPCGYRIAQQVLHLQAQQRAGKLPICLVSATSSYAIATTLQW